MVGFTGTIALATLIYVFFTFRLWRATNQSARAANASADAAKLSAEALVNSERAWVLGDVIGRLPDFTPDPSRVEILWVYVPLKNFGKTVARITKISTRQYQLPKTKQQPLPPDPEYVDHDTCDFVLAPNATFISTVGISASDFIAIRRGEVVLYIFGFVDYLILGGDRRQSRFCYIYHVPGGFNPNPEGFYPCTSCLPAYTRCT
jgi:hypothetical protein